ncbi:MAG: hypothetical protein N2320_03960, partial [Candidatus Bipolaricaulota bacterium]|nr:hypothetical protein [Candidatus Bipolaricaulota bacterium]
DHLFRLVVDEVSAICECQEGNNEVSTAARCGCPALVTDKAIAQILRSGVPVPTNSPVQPGDVITYTLQVTNAGTGWAFNVDLWDVLPVEFLYVAGSTSATWPGGSSTADPAGAPGPNLAWDLSATLRPGETLTLQFRAFVTSLARQDFRYTNTMGATGNEGEGTPIPPDSGLPGDTDPDDSDEVVHPAAVPALSLDKAIADVLRGGASRGPAGPVEPGDVIVYTVTIRNVGFGVAYDVDFTDELPAHVEYETAYGDGTYTVDSPAASGSLGIPDGATGLVTANISATVNPGGTLVATYRVRVLSSAAQGVDLVNRAATTGKDGAGNPIPEYNPDIPDTYPDRDATRIPVVEPGLALDKEIVDVLRGGVSIWPTPIVLWGDVIVYRVTVRNVGLGTAYDVDLTDTLPYGLAYDAGGDGTWTVDNPSASGTLGIPDGATGTIVANISATLAGGGTLTARYRARVLPEAPPGQYLVNLARVTGRDGAGTPIPEFNPDVADSYPDEDETRILLGVPALVTEKGIYCDPCGPEPCAPCPKPPFVFTVGDKVRFQLTVRNVGHTRAYGIRVEDVLPPGFTYVPESTRAAWPEGKSQADPVGAPGPELVWFTGASLDAGEALVLVFEALVTDKAPVGETLKNRMWAFGFDAQNLPIPADQSLYVPADDDPDDSSILELQVTRRAGGGNPWAGWAPWLGLGGLGLIGLLRLPARHRLKGLGLALLLFGLLATGVSAQAQGTTMVRIQVLVTPAEGGAVEGEGLYPVGAPVRLTALPSWGYQFVGWYEDRTRIGTGLTLEFTAGRDRVLEARFEPIPQSFTLGGTSQGSFAVLPTPGLERATLDLRYVLRYGAVPWTFRAVADFTGSSWTNLQLHGSGRMGEVQVGGGLTFDPAVPAYKTAYLALLHRTPDLTTSLRVTHYAQAGTPPGPYLLSVLSLRSGNLSFTARFEEKTGGMMFRDAQVFLTPLELCCGIAAQGTLSFTKAGFAFAQVTVDELIPLCCGVTLGFSVKFTPGAKEVSLLPRWESPCQGCLTLYGNVLWDGESRTWGGVVVHGIKLYCCWGGACPGGGVSSPFVEFVTALDPSQVPGGFQGQEFEYVKFGLCGPACCGGSYSLEGTAYFAPTGSLFGLSRILLTGGVPLFPGFTVDLKLAADLLGGTTTFSVGWNLRF